MSKLIFRKKLGYVLRNHRERMRWSQEKLARKLEIKYQQVQRHEYGGSKLTCEMLIAFAKIFNVTPESILLEARTLKK